MKGKIAFFSSLAIFSIGVGFFLSASKESRVTAKADGYTVDYNGGYVNIGSYPQKLVTDKELINGLNDYAVPVDNFKYEYKGNYYTPIEHFRASYGGVMLDNVYASSLYDLKCWFAWESILWNEIEIDDENNVTYFVSEYVMDTVDFQNSVNGDHISGSEVYANDYESSVIRAFVNYDFYQNAFNDDERTVAVAFKVKAENNTSNKDLSNEFASIPSKSQLSGKTKLLNAKGSHYAIAKSLKYPSDATATKAYYYLNSTSNNPNNHHVVDCATGADLSKSEEVNQTTVDMEMGVRPYIAIDNNKLIKRTGGNGGGGGGVHVNVPLIIGIVITIVGSAGLAVFFFLWGKHVVSFSFKFLPLIIIIICVVVTCTGLIMIFANTGGVGSGYLQSSPVGYYSTTEFTLDVNSKNFGYRFHLGLTSDHKVYRYYGDTVESARNYTLHPYPGVGTWQLRGKKLIISAPQTWELFRWELTETTYYATTSLGFAKDGMLMNDNDSTFEGYQVKGYRWYHSTTVEPTGEAVTMKEAGYNTSNWVSSV